MLFRFTLQNDFLGSLVINEPDGWKQAKLKLERDKNFKSMIEYFDGSFIFYGVNGSVNGGIDFIDEIELTQGFDAKINIFIDVSFDGYNYYVCFEGQLNLALSQRLTDNKIQIPIIRDDFWAKFINRLDTPVDIQSELSLDDEEVNQFDSINLNLTPQKIQQSYFGELSEGLLIGGDWGDTTQFSSGYIQVSIDGDILDEVDERFALPIALNPDRPVGIFEMKYGGSYHLTSTLIYSAFYTSGVSAIPTAIGNTIMKWYYQVNDDLEIEFDTYQINIPVAAGGASDDTGPTAASGFAEGVTLDVVLELRAGDTLRIYAKTVGEKNVGGATSIAFMMYGKENIGVETEVFLLYGSGSTMNVGTVANTIGSNYSFIKIIGQTVYPTTNAFSFLVHDLAGQITDRVISQNDTFYSEHLGSDKTLYRQYDADGCGWKYATVKGLQLRRYSLLEKPFFLSFNQFWEGINPILCLGLGYEDVNGSQVIRIEQMDHFYDSSATSIDISNVRQITRIYDQDVIFKTIKVGHNKWQSENSSGIDDVQTTHTYATRFVKTGTDLNLESDFIAASLAIETTRRTEREKSADYKYDNDTFIIAINPIPITVSPETSPDVNDYEPELDENFSSIGNLLNSETRYNSRITPARNLMRWIRYISGGLQSYLSSKFKFVSGEGNYDMTSDMVNTSDGCSEIKTDVSEKEDLPVYNDPLHLAMLYEIVVPMEWEEYLLIRENRKKAIGISQTTTGHVKFFIESLEYELVQSKATIKAWPVEFFEIAVLNEVPAMRSCVPVVVETCDNAYLTEDSFEYETEDGDCLILN